MFLITEYDHYYAEVAQMHFYKNKENAERCFKTILRKFFEENPEYLQDEFECNEDFKKIEDVLDYYFEQHDYEFVVIFEEVEFED